MSSILKALKKVENRYPEAIEVRSWPRKIDAKKAVSGSARRFPFFNRVTLIILAVSLVVGLTWYILLRNPSFVKKFLLPGNAYVPKKAVPVPRPRKITPPAKTAVEKTPEAESDQAPPTVGTESVPATESLENKIPPESFSDIPPEVEKKKIREPVAEAPVLKKEKRRVIASVKDSKIPDPSPPPVAREKETPQKIKTGKKNKTAKPAVRKPRRKNEPIATDSTGETGLNLQALVWSDDPGSCLAVIDDIIVRKGGRVKGYIVSGIGRNHVIVRKSGKKWKLKFK